MVLSQLQVVQGKNQMYYAIDGMCWVFDDLGRLSWCPWNPELPQIYVSMGQLNC